MNTALIIRDGYYPDVHVLECDGPSGDAHVNSQPRTFLGTLSFEEFRALPEHDKIQPASGRVLDFQSATRIVRILQAGKESGTISLRQINEIIRRMAVLFPMCVDCADDLAPPLRKTR